MTRRVAQTALRGSIWSAVERFSTQGVSFLVQIVLARILLPSDYGLVGMLAVFIALSQSFIDSGFSTALIQKQRRDSLDESTIFYFNIAVSVVVYALLYMGAPAIARFYDQPLLCKLLRILGLSLILGSFSVVQRAILTIRIDFKTQSKASFLAAILSGAVAITAAYLGAGVWALALQLLLSAFLNSALLFLFNSWRPSAAFSWQRLRSMGNYGSKILLSGLMYTLYNQMYTVIIGKRYSLGTLGCYHRAEQFYLFPSQNLYEILKRVYFPILCKMQDEREKLLFYYKKSLQLTTFIIAPLMAVLAAVSDPLIRIVLTDKWIDTVWMLQLLCIQGIFLPVANLNQNILNVIGMADAFLRIQTARFLLALGAILFTILLFERIEALIVCQIFMMIVLSALGAAYVKKYFDYGLGQMIADLYGFILSATAAGAAAFGLTLLVPTSVGQLFAGAAGGAIVYLGLVWGFNFGNIREMKHIFLRKR